jgi:hypothetical protein
MAATPGPNQSGRQSHSQDQNWNEPCSAGKDDH